jgi:homoserine O-acetyltransferase
MKYPYLITLLILPFLFSGLAKAQGAFRLADLGDLSLENGQTIQDCRIGYRTFGKLNKDRTNAILFPTWFTGTSLGLASAGMIGRSDKALDTLKYFVIAVDALGNGVSSSPSNSKKQPGSAFPQFSIRDMVQSQYLLLTQKLNINRLEAVVGISMGGMQTFQWLVSHPTFMFKAVPIVGTPRLTSQDLLLWHTELQTIEMGLACEKGEEQAMKTVAAIHALALTTPENLVRKVKREEFQPYLKEQEKGITTFKAIDWAYQLKAMMSHDIYKTSESAQLGKTDEETARSITARFVLIVTATQDHMVNPLPARELARMIQAQTLELTGDCGHLANGCEAARVTEAIKQLMSK